MQIHEVLAQRKFIAAERHARYNAHKSSERYNLSSDQIFKDFVKVGGIFFCLAISIFMPIFFQIGPSNKKL